MNIKTRDLAHRSRQIEQLTFRRTAMAIALAGITAFSAGSAYAAEDKTLAELQKALEVLKTENANLKKQLDNRPAQKADTAASESSTAGATEATSDTKSAASENTSILDAVVVKFKKKSVLETVKDQPKSISIVSGDELAEQGALNVKDIFKNIGNIKWDFGNAKTNAITIRGVSTTGGSTEQIIPDLGVTVDGVPYGYVPFITGSDFVDLQSVSIARGPQGSTGGLNSTMGTLNITSKQPSFTPEANASVTLGQQNALITQAAMGGAIVDDLLAWRGTFYRNQQDGYYQNAYTPITGRPNSSYNNVDRTFGRVQFLLTPSDKFSANFSIDDKPVGVEMINGLTRRNQTPSAYASGASYNYVKANDPLAVLSRPYFTNQGYNAQSYYNGSVLENQNLGIASGTKGVSAQLNWSIFDGYKLQSTTAYRKEYFQAGNDEGTPFDITFDSGLFVHYTQKSQELSLSSPVDPKRLADFKVGFLYLGSQSDANSRTNYGSDAGAWFASNTQYYGTGTSATAIAPGFVTGANVGSGLGSSSAGRQLLQDSLNGSTVSTLTTTDNQNLGLYGQSDWHLTDKLTLTTGLRLSEIENKTSQGKSVTSAGVGAALNPVEKGGFSTTTTGALTTGSTANSPAQLALAESVAQNYFGVPYASLTTAQMAQIASAKAIRASNPYSALYGNTAADVSNTFLPTGNIGLSYKLDEDLTSYVTWQRGGKSGVSQITAQLTAPSTTTLGTGRSLGAKAETTDAFELGIKGSFLNKTLIVNADVFQQYLHNFQQSTYIYDPSSFNPTTNPLSYISVTGNVPEVNVKGVEVDAAYTGIPYTTLRIAGSYNDATYAGGTLLAQPVENGDLSTKYRNVDGKTLPNSSKFSADLSAMYHHPVFGNKEFHTNINYSIQSKYNSDAALSSNAWVKGYGIADFGIGIGRQDKLFDVNLLVKNLFDTAYVNTPTWNSFVPTTNPRWVGIVFSSKL
jgi:outer membrane receptor protein involved in Fe transport